MTTYAKGSFELKSFDEQTEEEFDGGTKLTRATIVTMMEGDLQGEAKASYVMHYRADGTASFVGYQRFAGRIGERTGSFVQQVIGGYDGSEARTTSFVLPGSGTGELHDLSGEGTSAAPHGPNGTYTFNYTAG